MKAVITLLLVVHTLTMADLSFAQTWTQTSAPATNWTAVVSSADGTKLAAAVYVPNNPLLPPANSIFISTNSGITWTPSGVDLGGLGWDWNYLASSMDGSQLLAAPFLGLLCISTDAGTTWNFTGPSPGMFGAEYYWTGVASSPDGTKLAATAYSQDGAINNGLIFISTNSGATWTQANITFDVCWSIAFAAGGNDLIAGVMDDSIYISTNSGATWFASGSTNEIFWSVAPSADSSQIVASSYLFGQIYISKDSGRNWTLANAPNAVWQAIASSADGSKLVAAVSGGQIFTSNDSGTTWTAADAPSTNWISVAISADGNKLAAAAKGGGIWIAQTTPSPKLNLATSSNYLTLAWTLPSTNFLLQQSADLLSWSNVTNPPVLNLTNLQNQVTLPPSGSSGFYRLKTP